MFLSTSIITNHHQSSSPLSGLRMLQVHEGQDPPHHHHYFGHQAMVPLRKLGEVDNMTYNDWRFQIYKQDIKIYGLRRHFIYVFVSTISHVSIGWFCRVQGFIYMITITLKSPRSYFHVGFPSKQGGSCRLYLTPSWHSQTAQMSRQSSSFFLGCSSTCGKRHCSSCASFLQIFKKFQELHFCTRYLKLEMGRSSRNHVLTLCLTLSSITKI